MSNSVQLPRVRHARHRDFDGLDRGTSGVSRLRKLKVWVGDRVADLGGTGALTTFVATKLVAELDAVAHGFVSGKGPYRLSTSGTLPPGLEAGVDYWVGAKIVDVFTLHTSEEAAQKEVDGLIPTGAGTGTHSIAPSGQETAVVELLKEGVSPSRIQGSTDIDDFV